MEFVQPGEQSGIPLGGLLIVRNHVEVWSAPPWEVGAQRTITKNSGIEECYRVVSRQQRRRGDPVYYGIETDAKVRYVEEGYVMPYPFQKGNGVAVKPEGLSYYPQLHSGRVYRIREVFTPNRFTLLDENDDGSGYHYVYPCHIH